MIDYLLASEIILSTLDILIQSGFNLNLFADFYKVLESSHILYKLLSIVLDASELSNILVAYNTILFRIAMYNASLLQESVSRLALERNANPLHLLDVFIDQWMDKFDSLVYGKQRKLLAAALASFLSIGCTVVLDRLSSVMHLFTSVLIEAENG